LAKEELIKSERVYEGAFLRVRRDTVRVDKETGPIEAVREVVDHVAAVVLVPVDAVGNVLLVRQYRWAIESLLLEAPAGRLEQGEEPKDGARRELREETGQASDKLLRMGGFWMAPGYSTEYMYAFLATDLRTDPLPADDDEDIEVVPTPWKDIPHLIRNGTIQDSKSLSALQMAYFLFQNEAGVGA
jgi:ADP-ribose pyrophosphatase